MIVHKLFIIDDKIKYLCNQAVNPIVDKLTCNNLKVTCKKCLAMMNSQTFDPEDLKDE